MSRQRRRPALVLAAALLASSIVPAGPAPAQAAPEGEMRFAMYVTLAPAWYDPAEVLGFITPFWIMYALHDALVKPMPGNLMAPSLAESWTVSPDQRTYEFTLRQGVKFHNGDPFTAEDVKFSFGRIKTRILLDKVREVEAAGPHRVRIHLKEPWPDFMAFYGTLASGAAWIVPKRYMEQVGPDGFKKHPIGLGPYKFVSQQVGVELVVEANEQYWRTVPSVKRLVFRSVPDSSTRLAMLKRGEVDVAYLLDAPQAQEVKRDPNLRLAFSGGIGTFYLDYLDMWDPKSPWRDRRVRLAASHAIDRRELNQADTLGASKLNGTIVPRTFEFALPLEPHPYDPARAKQLLAEAGYPNGFDAGELHPWPPYTPMAEAVAGYLSAVGIRTRLRTMERAAFYAALGTKKLRGLCLCIVAVYGNAASRMSQIVPSEGAYAYGTDPEIEALYRQQEREPDRKRREALLHQIQRMMYDRVRFAAIYDYIWPSGIGPRVENAALMMIDPYPWAAPVEELRLKKP